MEQNKSLYNKSLKTLSKELRSNSTLGEILLWDKFLKAKGSGYQFNRQYPMRVNDLNIIVDFICRKLKLIIEIDGYSHNFKFEEDSIRDRKLNNAGYAVLRFSEQNVRHDLDNVVAEIQQKIEELENKSSE